MLMERRRGVEERNPSGTGALKECTRLPHNILGSSGCHCERSEAISSFYVMRTRARNIQYPARNKEWPTDGTAAKWPLEIPCSLFMIRSCFQAILHGTRLRRTNGLPRYHPNLRSPVAAVRAGADETVPNTPRPASGQPGRLRERSTSGCKRVLSPKEPFRNTRPA